MLSVVIIVAVLIAAIPIAVLVGMTFIAGGLGWFLQDDVDAAHEGTEHLELSRAGRPGD